MLCELYNINIILLAKYDFNDKIHVVMESGLKTTVLFQSNQLAPFVDLDTRWSVAVQTLNIALFAKCFYCNFAMELLDGLRKRNVGGNKEHLTEKKEEKEKRKVDLGAVDDVEPGTYWFTRIVFLRALAFVYCK